MEKNQTKELLQEIVQVLDDAQVPQDLRVVAFERVWDALSPAPTPRAQPSGEGAPGQEGAVAPEPILRLAARVRVEPNALHDLYAPDDQGQLRVVVASSQLSSSKAVAQRELALLHCAAQEATSEDATPASAIRGVCEAFGKLDAPNFAGNMKGGEKWWIIGGKRSDRTYRLRHPGWEEATRLVKRLAGVE